MGVFFWLIGRLCWFRGGFVVCVIVSVWWVRCFRVLPPGLRVSWLCWCFLGISVLWF